jgi:hypothetical protein
MRQQRLHDAAGHSNISMTSCSLHINVDDGTPGELYGS